jgi:signal transduction histidine kinase
MHRTGRLITLAVALAVLLAGYGWEYLRFGSDDVHLQTRVRDVVRLRIGDSAARLRAVADAAARDGALVARAADSPDALPALFTHLEATRLPSSPLHAISVYVPDGTGGQRLLAWSEGPAENLDGQAGVFADLARPGVTVVPGALGLRLMALAPVTVDGAVIGTVAAERIIATGNRLPDTGQYQMATPFGDVSLTPVNDAPTDRPDIVADDRGLPLVRVTFDPERVAATREWFRHRVWALALLPLLAMIGLTGVQWLTERRHATELPRFVLLSAALAAWSLLVGVAVAALGALAGLPDAAGQLSLALAAVGATLSLPVALWWRGLPRRTLADGKVRAAIEWLAAGVLTAGLLTALGLLIDRHVAAGGLDQLASPLFPFDAERLVLHLGRLSLALAAIWCALALHAALAQRWRVRTSMSAAALAISLGALPAAAVGAARVWWPSATVVAPVAMVAAMLISAAALAAAPLRRRYRRATQSTRLLLLFGATVLPALVIDPLVSRSAQQATERAIETIHGPATLGHPTHLLRVLQEATSEIDGLTDLPALVEPTPGRTGVSTDAAFRVWSRTGLSRARLTSAVELYSAAGTLTSRFALNVPEYGFDQSRIDLRCDWDVYGEVDRSEEVRMLHAERGICDSTGVVRGAIVLHVIFDYRALPFLAARSPYEPARDESGPFIDRLQVAVYGWSRLPLFTSSPSTWTIDAPLLSRLERSREPFWTTRRTEAGTARIYFLNDRAGIYALAYPLPTVFEHLSRLAETITLAALVFLVLLAAATLAAPVTRRAGTPLRDVVKEVRTSFYRKLFLFFVLTALVPVGVLALSFSAYMSDQLRSDVETEALGVVAIARRVLEDTLTLQTDPLSDDLMVWISRLINQDVNLYDGTRLRATSQRDLFDAGVLPERTPARAFRAVVLDRVPTFVEESHAGPFTSLVAAAPVPRLGADTVLLVPLAPRQREIEREISDVNRGVLLGAVCIVLLSAGLGAWVAQRVADPVARLTRATRQIASGRLDVRIVADTADELQRLVTDFNSMAATLREQRAELGRTHELKAWADMSRQVAHDIKNPLTPIQLAAEHLQRVHIDRDRPLGPVFDQCISTILQQVRLLRQIASEFSTFAASPTPTLVPVPVGELIEDLVRPYRAGLPARTTIATEVADGTPDVLADRILLTRALTNLVENALQAMPGGGTVTIAAAPAGDGVEIQVRDTGIGMSASALTRAFEPHFSTKTGGSGLGLANAKRNIEACGGSITADSIPDRGTTMRVRVPAAPMSGR